MPRTSFLRAMSVAIAAAVLLSVMPSGTAAAATNNVTVTGDPVTGGTLSVDSRFSAPGGAAGNYVVDTEVFDRGGTRVGQWYETVYLSGTATSRRYSWNLSGVAAGDYRFAQGVFNPGWAGNRYWENNAGTVAVKSTASAQSSTGTSAGSTSFNLTGTATVNSTSDVRVTSNFTFPSNFSSQAVVLDTEVANSAGQKVAQWAENHTAGASQTFNRSYTWNPSGLPAGTYTLRQGVFNHNWTHNHVWKGNTSTVTIGSSASAPAPAQTQTQTQTSSSSGGSPFAGVAPYVRPGNPAQKQADAWRSYRPSDASVMDRISNGGVAVWLGGWTADIQGEAYRISSAAAAQGRMPVFVAYNIPLRDCGQYSGGGAANADAYRNWIRSIAAGIGSNRAAVVLEPDALSQLDCLDSWRRNERLSLMSEAVGILSSNGRVSVYLDAGHPGWHSATEMSNRLKAANVAGARGFALNVANYATTSDNINFGNAVSAQTGKKFVIDTSRNGNGGNGQWCNATGRALGPTPTGNTGHGNVDAFLWVKQPGESDGYCNGGPGAGQWWADYALGLGRNAGY